MNAALIAEWQYALKAADYAPRTVRDRGKYMTRFAAWLATEGTALAEVTKATAERYMVDLASAEVRRQFVFAAKSFSAWAADEELCEDWAKRLKTPKVQQRPQATATTEDVQRLLEACSGRAWTDRRDAAIVSVLASTGVRRSEAARMTLSDIDLDAGFVIIPVTKNGKSRRTYLDADAVRRLNRYLRARPDAGIDALWITTRGGPITDDGIRQMFERRSAKAGVKVSPHQLRRRLAYEWLRRGGSQPALMSAAGWTTTAMPARYVAAVAADLAAEEHNRLFSEPPAADRGVRYIKRRKVA